MTMQPFPSLTGPEPDPLLIRLERELSDAAREFKANPRRYLRALFASDHPGRFWRALSDGLREFITDPGGSLRVILTRDRSERNRMKALSFGATLALLLFTLVVGTSMLMTQRSDADVASLKPEKIIHLGALPPVPLLAPPAAERAGGGGGGGLKEPTPPSRGRLPEASLRPPVVSPTPHPPTVEHPALPVEPTIQVQPDLLPPPDRTLPLGLPDSLAMVPSAGPGSGGGIGSGRGGGVGPGHGTGYGPGEGWNTGGGSARLGGGDGAAIGQKVRILFLPRPDWTEEARRNRIQGKVLLNALFTTEGQVRDIQVVRGLGYGLDEMAIDAARRIRFNPATDPSGRPISVRMTVAVDFRLL